MHSGGCKEAATHVCGNLYLCKAHTKGPYPASMVKRILPDGQKLAKSETKEVDIADPKNPSNFNIFPLVHAANVEGLRGLGIASVTWKEGTSVAVLHLLPAADSTPTGFEARIEEVLNKLKARNTTVEELREQNILMEQAGITQEGELTRLREEATEATARIHTLEAQVAELQALLADDRRENSGVPVFNDDLGGERAW